MTEVKGSISIPASTLKPGRSSQLNLNSEITGFLRTVANMTQEKIKERATAPIEIKDESLGFLMVKKIIRTNDKSGNEGMIQE